MPKTKEQKAKAAARQREWRKTPKGKASILATLEKCKERVAKTKRAYNRSPVGKMKRRIDSWKRQGIIPENWDYEALYERFINTTHCEKCNVEMTTDERNTSTTKCCDHDHDIKDAPNVRGIICLRCNQQDLCTNTSGEVHVRYRKEDSHWMFEINRKPLRHCKYGFKTIEEAVAYRDEWIALNSESR